MNNLEKDKVLVGKDGWLFLDNDTNNSVGQFQGEIKLNKNELEKYSTYLDTLKEKISCEFCFCIAPNKEYVLPDKYPFDIRAKSPNSPLIHEQVIDILKKKNIKFSYPVKELSNLEDSYYKTDTHWSDYGAYHVLKNMLFKLFDVNLIDLEKGDFKSKFTSGDLGNKLDNRKDYCLNYGFDVSSYQVFHSGIKNYGLISHHINKHSKNNKKILLFADSFGISFIKSLVLTFREVVFVYHPASHIEDIYKKVNPDFVIFQINQRFLIETPIYRNNIENSLVYKKINKFTLDELTKYRDTIIHHTNKSYLVKLYLEGIESKLSVNTSEKILNKSCERELLFDGKYIEVVTNILNDIKNIVITFSSRSDKPQKHGFGEEFFQNNNISAIHFIRKSNHWWQIQEMNEAITKVLPKLKGYQNICTYGASMGGHGALIHSEILGATNIITGSPQYSINGRLVPSTPRWERDTKNVSEIFKIERNCSQTANIYCIYDPFERFDVMHINQLEKIRSIIKIHTPFSGHSAILHLQKIGLLSVLVKGIIRENFKINDFRINLKNKRRKNIKYLFGLGIRASQKKSRKKVSTWAYEQATIIAKEELNKNNTNIPHIDILMILKIYCANLIHNHKSDEALLLAKKYCDNYPNIVFSHELLCHVFWKMKNYKEALTESQRALRLSRQNASLRLQVVRLHLILNQIDKVEYHLNAALSFPSKDEKAWLGVLKELKNISKNADYQEQFLEMQKRISNKISNINPSYSKKENK